MRTESLLSYENAFLKFEYLKKQLNKLLFSFFMLMNHKQNDADWSDTCHLTILEKFKTKKQLLKDQNAYLKLISNKTNVLQLSLTLDTLEGMLLCFVFFCLVGQRNKDYVF
jgi:hypothetical protein